jgi:hypothetical protein
MGIMSAAAVLVTGTPDTMILPPSRGRGRHTNAAVRSLDETALNLVLIPINRLPAKNERSVNFQPVAQRHMRHTLFDLRSY